MEVGYYNHNPVDFTVYRASNFNVYLEGSPSGCCGANALSMLTGADSRKILKGFKYNNDIQDAAMIAFLKKRKFKVIPITQCEVSNNWQPHSRIKTENVLLCSQLMLKNEASWTVIYRGNVYHNFCVASLNGLEFINRPILTAYVVYLKKWN